MSYLSDEQIKNEIGPQAFAWWLDNRAGSPQHGDFGEGSISGATIVRDLYEAHLKEKDELLREAAGALEEVLGGSKIGLCDHLSHPLSGDRHKLGEPCPPTERIAALLSRINTHLESKDDVKAALGGLVKPDRHGTVQEKASGN